MDSTQAASPRRVVVNGHAVKRVREELLGATQPELAEFFGLSVPTLQRLEREAEYAMQRSSWSRMSLLMGSSAEALLVGTKRLRGATVLGVLREDEAEFIKHQFELFRARHGTATSEPVSVRMIPFFEVRIPAGAWTDTPSGRGPEGADGSVPVPLDAPSDSFALRIYGDCMEPSIADGSIIVFVPIVPGRIFEPGKLYYVQTLDERATFKRVYWEPAANRYRLECENPKYRPIYVRAAEVARLSRAIKMLSDL